MPPQVLFHCTYAKNLDAIAKHGLRPGLSPNLMRASPGNHRGVYLCDEDGVRFWFRKLVDHAEDRSETPAEDGLVPVVLRVETTCKVVDDERGTRDSGAVAVVCPRPIVPGALKVWNGSAWARSGDAEGLAEKGSRWEVDEDFEAGGYLQLLEPSRSPLMPKGGDF